MPRVIVVAEPVDSELKSATLDERVLSGEVRSEHFSAHLLERIGWALEDAERGERSGEPARL